jgi:hypothetical protein
MSSIDAAGRRTWRRRLRAAWLTPACVLLVALAASTTARAASPAPPAATTGTLIGHVSAPSADGSAAVAAAGVLVTATDPATGTADTVSTDADGFYEIDDLPAATYAVSFALTQGQPQSTPTVAVAAGASTTLDDGLPGPLATFTGVIADHHHRALPGMAVGLGPTGPVPCPAGSTCGTTATTGATGIYTLSLAPGTYELRVLDGNHVLDAGPVTGTAGETTSASFHLTPASVPAGSSPAHAARDLRWLNAERDRMGLGAGIVLNPRWSQECAAHDGYERANGVLSQSENPQAPGASVGGAWAGLVSVLAQSRWTQARDPWQNAPIHLMQLFTPSLSVIGIDDSAGLQCATTYPGLQRAPVATDTVTTYPEDGARGVPPREVAREAPFVPGQFVGIAPGRAAGRELFVYLNQSGRTGQAQADILRATLTQGRKTVAVRWVDNTTRTIGRYLTGAIVIPVRPLRGRTTYRATVVMRDRSGTLSHSWTFTTAHS